MSATRVAAILGAALVASTPAPAAAQEFGRSDDETGVRLGVWRFEPVIEAGFEYDDNIFRSDVGTRGSLIARARASATLRSDWRRHSASVVADFETGVFASSSADDYLDGGLRFEGVLDATRAARLRLRARVARESERRGGDDLDVDLAEPVKRFVASVEATGQYAPGRLRIQPTISWRREDFADARRLNGAVADQDDRDRTRFGAALLAGWRWTRKTELFAEGGVGAIDFDDGADSGGADRDGVSARALAGARFRFSDLLEGSAALGVAHRSYDDPALVGFIGPVAEIDATWRPTRLIALRFGFARGIEETTIAGASGADVTTASVAADWDIRRFLDLRAQIGFENRRFRGAGRTDRIFSIGAGADWSLSPHATLTVFARRVMERSNAPGEDHDATQIAVSATYRF